MVTKILYKQFMVGKTIELIYDESKGVILNKNINKKLYKLSVPEIKPYFYFKLEFDSYQYDKIYLPKTNFYKKQFVCRIYRMYLYLNIKLLSKINSHVNIKLGYHLYNVQFDRLSYNRTQFRCSGEEIGGFIEKCDSHPSKLISWQFIQINDDYVFDINSKNILPYQNIKKIKYSIKGGLIETNNVKKLLADNFRKDTKSLIILPTSLTNLWDDTVKKITYDDPLLKDIRYLTKLKKYKIKRIIIHECHMQYMPHVKKLVSILNCKLVWIINSLPINYYFSSAHGETTSKLNVNQIFPLVNLWFNFTAAEKKKYKIEIIKYILSDLDKKYRIVNYQDILVHPKIINLKTNEIEKYIHNQLYERYNNWRSKLTNNHNNIYSMTTEKNCVKMESKLLKTSVWMLLSIKKKDEIIKHFDKFNKHVLDKCIEVKNQLDYIRGLIKTNANNSRKQIAKEMYQNISNEIDENNIIISNYKRYSDGTIYQNLDDKDCPICYSDDDDIPKCKLICGHTFCIECIFNVLSKHTKCPVCNEFITYKQLVIIKESIAENSSELVSYLSNMSENMALLTDMDIFDNLVYPFHVININSPSAFITIKNIMSIDHLVILISSKINIAEKIVNYYGLLNTKIQFSKINLIF